MQTSPPPGFPFKGCGTFGEDEVGKWFEFTVSNIVQRMRWIVPGTFLMGSPEYEHHHKFHYETQHEVTLSRGFWIADTACSQELWLAVMGANPSKLSGAKNPVENVSWEDCGVFLHKADLLLREISLTFPTEAQWEYACRAGTTTPFSFGLDITPELVNYNGEYPYFGEKKALNRNATIEVKSLPPNQWGLYEMHGNVWEWCYDWFDKYEPGCVKDPAGPSTGTYRVLRGGSAFSGAPDCRCAARFRFHPDKRYGRNGFRFVWNPPAIETQKERQAAERHAWSDAERKDEHADIPNAFALKAKTDRRIT